MRVGIDRAHSSVRSHHTHRFVVQGSGTPRPLRRLRTSFPVVRMNELEKSLQGRFELLARNAANPEQLVRPRDRPLSHVPFPAANVGHRLRFPQLYLAREQGFVLLSPLRYIP